MPRFEFDNCTIEYEIGDCLELMKDIPDKSIDLVLTDIPYNISRDSNGLRELDYGEWDKQAGMENEWITGMEALARKSIIVFCHKTQFGGILDYLIDRNYLVKPIVLDPFAGSGTTLEVARRLGRRSIGIDINPEYKEIALKRKTLSMMDLFSIETENTGGSA